MILLSRFLLKLFKLCLLLWTVYLLQTNIIKQENIKASTNWLLQDISSITLVIAHPDDEVMFFAPTLLNLNSQLRTDIPLNVICLSQGVAVNGSDAGGERVEELKHSISLLINNRRKNAVTVLDFPDGMDESWDTNEISKQVALRAQLSKESAQKRKALFLTFDSDGVSHHPNHVAAHDGVQKLLQEYNEQSLGLFLNSYNGNIAQKYGSFIFQLVRMNWNVIQRKYLTNTSEAITKSLTFYSTFSQYMLSFATMLNAHESQMVWFRYGWWVLSSYVFTNELEFQIL